MNFKYNEQLVLDLLKNNTDLSTFELQAKGFCSPSTIIYALRNKGVLITTTLKTTIGPSGRVHNKVAHYSLVGGQQL